MERDKLKDMIDEVLGTISHIDLSDKSDAVATLTLAEMELKLDKMPELTHLDKGVILMRTIIILTARLITLSGQKSIGSLEMHQCLTTITNHSIHLAYDTLQSIKKDQER